jgi:hypothetical protein
MHKQLHNADKVHPDRYRAGYFYSGSRVVLTVACAVGTHAWNATQSRTLALSLTLRRGLEAVSHVICTNANMQHCLLTQRGKHSILSSTHAPAWPASTRPACMTHTATHCRAAAGLIEMPLTGPAQPASFQAAPQAPRPSTHPPGTPQTPVLGQRPAQAAAARPAHSQRHNCSPLALAC